MICVKNLRYISPPLKKMFYTDLRIDPDRSTLFFIDPRRGPRTKISLSLKMEKGEVHGPPHHISDLASYAHIICLFFINKAIPTMMTTANMRIRTTFTIGSSPMTSFTIDEPLTLTVLVRTLSSPSPPWTSIISLSGSMTTFILCSPASATHVKTTVLISSLSFLRTFRVLVLFSTPSM